MASRMAFARIGLGGSTGPDLGRSDLGQHGRTCSRSASLDELGEDRDRDGHQERPGIQQDAGADKRLVLRIYVRSAASSPMRLALVSRPPSERSIAREKRALL